MLAEVVRQLAERRSLDERAAEQALDHIISGQASPTLVAAFLAAMRVKGETVAELVGGARAMRRAALAVSPRSRPLLDTCGTGGGGGGTVNISTAAAFVAAACGVRVAKHGNRSVSSRCGSADLLEALGASLELGPERVADCIDQVGIGFMMAPRFHPAMRHVAELRRELGFRTIFNLLGPLSNPAAVEQQVLGVFDEAFCEPMAEAVQALGCRSALVVHGHGGLDEISPSGPTRALRLQDGHLQAMIIEPAALGLPLHDLAELRGGTPQENAAVVRQALGGAEGAVLDAILLNAAAALLVAAQVEDMRDGLELARKSIQRGAASDCLERFVAFC